METVIILTIVSTLLTLLLILAIIILLSYRRELKSYYFLQDTLKEYFKKNTEDLNAIEDSIDRLDFRDRNNISEYSNSESSSHPF